LVNFKDNLKKLQTNGHDKKAWFLLSFYFQYASTSICGFEELQNKNYGRKMKPV